MTKHTRLSILLTALCLAACGGGSSDAVAAGPATATNTMEPNQRLQGTIELDVGHGAIAYRSLATTVSADLGKQAKERLASSDGQRALADANDRLKGNVKVDASDVQDLADAFAGRTLYTSELRDIDIVKRRSVTLSGKSSTGASVSLTLSLDMADNRLQTAVLEYVPDGKQQTQSFTSKGKDAGAAEVTIDRFEKVNDDTWAITGRFTAGPLVPGVLAKKLAGQSIAEATGRFDIAEVHVRPGL